MLPWASEEEEEEEEQQQQQQEQQEEEQEQEEQEELWWAYPISIAWASHIADSVLTWGVKLYPNNQPACTNN